MLMTRFHRAVSVLLCSAAGLLAALPQAALAQDSYPNRPIKVVLPFAAGGGTDYLGRMVSEKLASRLGQPVAVENRPGANGMIASAAVAKAPPDGYTLLMMNAGIAQNPAIYPSMPYRTEELIPLAQLTVFPSAFAVQASSGINTLAEFVAHVRNKPGTVTWGSWGVGSGGHFYGAVFNIAAGIDMTHVPYKGETAAITDLLGGRITAVFGSPGLLAQHVKRGALRILAVTGPRRLQSFPDIQTFSEAGYPSVNLAGWAGFFAPAGTPMPIVERLSAELLEIGRSAEVSAKITEFGWVPTPAGRSEFAAFFGSELTNWEKLVKQTGIKPE